LTQARERQRNNNGREPKKLKHFSAHVAIDWQSSIALSQGLILPGQQSGMSAMTAVSVISADFRAPTAPVVTGSVATDKMIRNARIVRAVCMEQTSLAHEKYQIARV
jgi:hypothetical protein